MLDLFADFSTNDPAEAFAAAAAGCPHQWEPETRSLYAFSARDVRHVLTSGDFWSEQGSDHRVESLSAVDRERWDKLNEFFLRWPVFSDGKHHKMMRHTTIALLRGAVTPELIDSCARLVRRKLAEAGASSFDWMEQIARPVTVDALGTLLGGAHAERLIELSREITAQLAASRVEMTRVTAALDAIADLRRWLGETLADPAEGASGFIAKLAQLWHEDFGPDSTVALLTQIVTGAYDPVVASLGLCAERVTGDVLARLPLDVVREEVFRLATPFRFASRYARRPVSLGSHSFDTGDRIALCLGAANMDPDHYPKPLEFHQRDQAHSLSFGAGAHYCPGAPLARAVVGVLLTALAESGTCFAVERVEREPELPMLRYRRLTGHLVPATSH